MSSKSRIMEDYDDDDDGDESETVNETDAIEINVIDLNEPTGRPVPSERVSKQEFGQGISGFENEGFDSDIDDNENYDDGIRNDIKKSEISTEEANISKSVDNFVDVDRNKENKRYVSQQKQTRKSVTFKNGTATAGITTVSGNKPKIHNENNSSQNARRSVTIITPDDTEDEESEPEKELSDGRDFPLDLMRHIERLRQSGKVEQAALIDLNGNILVRSRGMDIKPEDAETVLRVLKSPDRSLVKFRIGKENFTCFKNSENSFIGKSENDFLCVSSCLDFVVVGISDPNSPGSCIHEVSRFVKRCNRNSNASISGLEGASV